MFLCGNQLLIVRHWSGATVKLLRNRQDLDVIYFIDDDIWEEDEHIELPASYRTRLARLKTDYERELADRVVKIVSPSERILSRFQNHTTRKLDPALIYSLPALDHHTNELNLSIVFSATTSHAADLKKVSGEIARFLGEHPHAHLTTFLGDQAPSPLQLPNCTHLTPVNWETFRTTMGTRRFHIGIAPANPTSFNASRSATRVLDHAAFGAAGLYSQDSGPAAAVSDGEDGVLVGHGDGAWAKALERLDRERELCRTLAAAGQARARQIGKPERLKAFWCKELGIDEA